MTDYKDTKDFEDIDDAELPVEGTVLSKERPDWAKALAWATVALGALYMVNPTAGIFELIPDVVPIVGNLDEAAVMFLVFGAMRYLGMRLPDFIERWTPPVPRLLSPPDREKE